MIDIDKYEGHTEGEWTVGARKGAITVKDSNGEEIAATNSYPIARLMADAPLLLEEVKRLSEENKKQLDVLSTLDEMIRFGNDHVEMMKALEQGLDLTETWKEMNE